jgi:hypothetical protein
MAGKSPIKSINGDVHGMGKVIEQNKGFSSKVFEHSGGCGFKLQGCPAT